MTNSLLASFFGKSECGKELTTFRWRNMTTMGMLQRLPNAATVPTPAPSQRSGTNGGDGNMEQRVTSLEESVKRIETNVQKLSGDIRKQLGTGIGAMGAIICGAWTLYSNLSADIVRAQDKLSADMIRVDDKLSAELVRVETKLSADIVRVQAQNTQMSDRMTTMEVRLTGVEDKMEAENTKITDLQASVNRIAGYLDRQQRRGQ